MRGKKGQFFETLIIIGGIIMVLTAVFSVIYSRSNIPSESPSLQAKEILQTHDAFDAVELFIELSFKEAVRNTNLLQSFTNSPASTCTRQMSFDKINLIVMLRTCDYNLILNEFEDDVFNKLNDSFTDQRVILDTYALTSSRQRSGNMAAGSYQTSEFLQYPPALWTQTLDASQMDMYFMKKNQDYVLTGIYRKPLEYTTTKSSYWKIDARRFVFVNAQLNDESSVMANLLLIHKPVILETYAIMDRYRDLRQQANNNGPASVDEKKSMLIEINSALLKLEPRLTKDKMSFYYYNLTVQNDVVYVLFPNLQFGLEITPFI